MCAEYASWTVLLIVTTYVYIHTYVRIPMIWPMTWFLSQIIRHYYFFENLDSSFNFFTYFLKVYNKILSLLIQKKLSSYWHFYNILSLLIKKKYLRTDTLHLLLQIRISSNEINIFRDNFPWKGKLNINNRNFMQQNSELKILWKIIFTFFKTIWLRLMS